MLAYKFRSASQLDFAFDIIINSRLRCSDWRQLNDPIEGVFAYSTHASDEQDHSAQVSEIIRRKQRLLICSLSRTFDCHLLWAHYASGFQGLAIEVNLPEKDPKIRVIKYRGVFAHLPSEKLFRAERAAEEILSSKYQEWNYEQEVRIIQSGEWYKLATPVKRVIAGHRMRPATLDALQIVCERRGITLHRTGSVMRASTQIMWLPSMRERGVTEGNENGGRSHCGTGIRTQ